MPHKTSDRGPFRAREKAGSWPGGSYRRGVAPKPGPCGGAPLPLCLSARSLPAHPRPCPESVTGKQGGCCEGLSAGACHCAQVGLAAASGSGPQAGRRPEIHTREWGLTRGRLSQRAGRRPRAGGAPRSPGGHPLTFGFGSRSLHTYCVPAPGRELSYAILTVGLGGECTSQIRTQT